VAAAAALAGELDLSPALAAILVRRGYADPARARSFLAADERTEPQDLHGVPGAAELIRAHVQKGTRIAVFGDYDVDGVCSTAMLIRALRGLGAEPVWRLPSREAGYGLSLDAIGELSEAGAGLLITVDCGITATAEVADARARGMDVIVTDHHRPGDELPDCPVVHPGLGDRPSSELCAAGVVLKLSAALTGTEEDLDLAGLATVCDMVPLHGENRRIAREGLQALARTTRPGLRALMRVAGLEPGDVDAQAAGFRLGPRINAAGRLQRADAALELLLTDDADRAEEVARELDLLNLDRRATEQRILHAAEALCADQMSAAAIVVAGEGWHPGVVGIVASRLVERHRRPCVVIALEGGSGRGSGRSIGPYDLHAGLVAASGHLTRFGGHRMAAGLEIDAAAVSAFRATLAAHAAERLSPEDMRRVQRVDAVVPGGALRLELAEELEHAGPFGQGNPAPVLMVPGARVEHVTAMGEEGAHARFSLRSGGARARGVAFRTSQRSLAAAGAAPHDVAVSLERNRWNGAVEARVVLRSLSETRPGTLTDVAPEEFWGVLEAELERDPAEWFPVRPAPTLEHRVVCDRRGEGLSGVAGDLLTSGDPVLLVVADVERRRAGLEALLAGLDPEGAKVCAWTAVAALQHDGHLLAIDPPPVPDGLDVLRAVPGEGLVHLAWGEPEREFALAHWRSQLDLRPSLTEVWRAAAEAGTLEQTRLEEALRGGGTYPRSGALCGRLLRVLGELGLAEFGGRTLKATPGPRTELGRSSSNRAYAARLAEMETWLGERMRVAA
jgi:single-stranded-DNA-specific exonuclease